MALMILYRQNSRKSKIKNCVNVNQKPTENHLFYVVAYYEKCSVYKKIIFIINPQGIYLLTKTSSYGFNLKRYTQALVFNTCPSYSTILEPLANGAFEGDAQPDLASVCFLVRRWCLCHAPHCQALLCLHHYGGKNPSETK